MKDSTGHRKVFQAGSEREQDSCLPGVTHSLASGSVFPHLLRQLSELQMLGAILTVQER